MESLLVTKARYKTSIWFWERMIMYGLHEGYIILILSSHNKFPLIFPKQSHLATLSVLHQHITFPYACPELHYLHNETIILDIQGKITCEATP
jgi:hypothetical protein